MHGTSRVAEETKREKEWEWQSAGRRKRIQHRRGKRRKKEIKKRNDRRIERRKRAIAIARDRPTVTTNCPWKDLDTLYSRRWTATDRLARALTLSRSFSFFLRGAVFPGLQGKVVLPLLLAAPSFDNDSSRRNVSKSASLQQVRAPDVIAVISSIPLQR